jgi:hypothetical protein
MFTPNGLISTRLAPLADLYCLGPISDILGLGNMRQRKVQGAAIQSLTGSYYESILSQATAQLSYTYLTNPDSSTIGLTCHSSLLASYRADYDLKPDDCGEGRFG